jgi:hypothetical protein
MYSGLTLTRFSGRMLGTHQKIDRVARKHLRLITPAGVKFPLIKDILHFEGKNGPDAIKRKSPAVDEPWHYFNPFDETHKAMFDLIDAHYQSLVIELKAQNHERAAFEASWLAHALVDGLTPAHHYPYEEELKILRGGKGLESRTTIKEKWIIPGDTTAEKLRNNWKMWGAKGLAMSHGMFEMGVATLLKPLSFSDTVPTAKDIDMIKSLGPIDCFKQVAREIAVLDMYRKFIAKGWTSKLAYQVRHNLGPTMVKTVALVWYAALIDAGLIEK